jgi:hypothetical protein
MSEIKYAIGEKQLTVMEIMALDIKSLSEILLELRSYISYSDIRKLEEISKRYIFEETF